MRTEEALECRFSCVYMITFPNGRKYVGKTKDFRDRVRLYRRKVEVGDFSGQVMKAIQKYGLDVLDWSVLVRLDGLDGDDLELCLSILEIKYIRENGSLYPDGYNTSIGGEMLGIPASVIKTKFGVDGCSYASKPVLLYKSDGVFYMEYSSIGSCAEDFGVGTSDVRRCIDANRLLVGLYLVREKDGVDIPQSVEPFKPSVVEKTKVVVRKVYEEEKVFRKREVGNAVIMYDKNGDYVGLFDNVRRSKKYLQMDFSIPFGREFRGVYIFHYNGGEIIEHLGAFTSKNVTTIFYDDILALAGHDDIGERISLHLQEEDKELSVRQKKERVARQVNKYTLVGEFVCSYQSISDAASENGVLDGSVRSCCNRKSNTCGGAIYRYADDTKPVVYEKREMGAHAVYEKRKGRVGKFTLDGKFVKDYPDIASAAKENNLFSNSIRCCLIGKTRKSGGFIWKYMEKGV